MRKFIFLLLILSYSCTGVKSTYGGLKNESFISIYSDKIFGKEVDVFLDDKINFNAIVNKTQRNSTNYSKRPKGTNYSVEPGLYNVKVLYQGKILYNKKLLLSNQQSKIIEL
jgi:hypothetical protein